MAAWGFDAAPTVKVSNYNDQGVQVLQYPYTESIPQREVMPRHFAAICRPLARLHKDAVVHGDIRRANIVFASQPIDSRLIDFDFAGRCGAKKYPIGYIGRKLEGEWEIAERHVGAVAKAKLKYEHDLVALARTGRRVFLGQTDPTNSTDSAALVSGTATESLVQVLDHLEQGRFVPDPTQCLDTTTWMATNDSVKTLESVATAMEALNEIEIAHGLKLYNESRRDGTDAKTAVSSVDKKTGTPPKIKETGPTAASNSNQTRKRKR
jgi:serine/threonine protein kinase